MSEIINETERKSETLHEEWLRKSGKTKSPKVLVRNGEDVYKFMSESEELEKLEKEHSWILHLNTNKKITKKELYRIGSDSRICFSSQEIFLRYDKQIPCLHFRAQSPECFCRSITSGC